MIDGSLLRLCTAPTDVPVADLFDVGDGNDGDDGGEGDKVVLVSIDADTQLKELLQRRSSTHLTLTHPYRLRSITATSCVASVVVGL